MERNAVSVADVVRILEENQQSIDKLKVIITAHTFQTDKLKDNPTTEEMNKAMDLLGLTISDIVIMSNQLEANHKRIKDALDSAQIYVDL